MGGTVLRGNQAGSTHRHGQEQQCTSEKDGAVGGQGGASAELSQGVKARGGQNSGPQGSGEEILRNAVMMYHFDSYCGFSGCPACVHNACSVVQGESFKNVQLCLCKNECKSRD